MSDRLTFAEAVSIFCNKWCALREASGEPVMLSEFLSGLATEMAAKINQLPYKDRADVCEAVKAALDEGTTRKRRMRLN